MNGFFFFWKKGEKGFIHFHAQKEIIIVIE